MISRWILPMVKYYINVSVGYSVPQSKLGFNIFWVHFAFESSQQVSAVYSWLCKNCQWAFISIPASFLFIYCLFAIFSNKSDFNEKRGLWEFYLRFSGSCEIASILSVVILPFIDQLTMTISISFFVFYSSVLYILLEPIYNFRIN